MFATSVVWAIVGVPVSWITFVVILVKVADGKPPFHGPAQYWATGLFFVLLISGTVAISKRFGRRRAGFASGYGIVMAMALGVLTVVASVAAGDIQ
jgi:hypothetical protein